MLERHIVIGADGAVAAGGCAGCMGCAASARSPVALLRHTAAGDATPGTSLRLEISERGLLGVAAALFGAPLLALIGGGYVGRLLGGESMAMLAGLGALVGAMLLLRARGGSLLRRLDLRVHRQPAAGSEPGQTASAPLLSGRPVAARESPADAANESRSWNPKLCKKSSF